MIKAHQMDAGNAKGIFRAFSIAICDRRQVEIFVDSQKTAPEMKIATKALNRKRIFQIRINAEAIPEILNRYTVTNRAR